jgi:hypothetical protein
MAGLPPKVIREPFTSILSFASIPSFNSFRAEFVNLIDYALTFNSNLHAMEKLQISASMRIYFLVPAKANK